MSLIDSIIGATTTAIGILASPSSSGSGNKPAKGSAQIQAYVNQVLSALDNVINQLQGVSASERQSLAQQVLSQAQAVVSSLSNPAVVYQAKRGEDAQILATGKTQAQNKLQQLTAMLQGQGSTTATPVVTTNPVTGQQQVQYVQGATQADNSLLYAGIGVLALVLLLRK